MAYQSAAIYKSVLYKHFSHQWTHTDDVYGISGSMSLCTCIRARVCTWCVYMSRFREGVYDSMNRNKLEVWK